MRSVRTLALALMLTSLAGQQSTSAQNPGLAASAALPVFRDAASTPTFLPLPDQAAFAFALSNVRQIMGMSNGVLGLYALAAGGAIAQSGDSGLIDASQRATVISHLLSKVREFYLSSEIAPAIEAAITRRHAAGEYERYDSPVLFVQALTRDLQSVSLDKHLLVQFSAEPLGPEVPADPPDVPVSPWPASETEAASARDTWRRRNCGFVNVAALIGNVGYLKFDAFPSPSVCGDTAAAAMSFVADCRALIVDLRDNSGGDPAMVAFISSYLFSRPVHLNDIYAPRTGVTVQSWTLPTVQGRRFSGQSVFVLISPRTFSAAEEFAYNLQMLKRATVIGQYSGGGAHAALPLRLDAHFLVSIPFARSVNPISRTNWEGAGVRPDVYARENVTVQTAYRLALTELAPAMLSSAEQDAVRRQIDAVTKAIESAPLEAPN